MRDFLNITKALADESRLRVLLALRREELCLCQIIEFLGLAPSTVSKHMAILLQAGLVECRKDGRWRYYRLPGGKKTAKVVRRALRWIVKSLKGTPAAAADEKRLCGILKKTKAELCARYKC